MIIRNSWVLKSIIALTLMASGCRPLGDEKIDESLNGKLADSSVRFLLTDSPFPIDLVKSAEVEISAVSIREMGTGMFLPIPTTVQRFDLTQLRNGVFEMLGKAEIPAGKYDQIRIVLGEAVLTLNDGRSFPLKVPSAQSSGLKINIAPAIEVSTGLSNDILIDFDLSRSFQIVGKKRPVSEIRGFIMKPVLRASNMTKAGSISGTVSSDTGPVLGALVSVYGEDTTAEAFSTALTEADGSYKLIGVPAGKYTVIVMMDECVSRTKFQAAVA